MCMENNNTVMKLQQTFGSEAHNIFTKKCQQDHIECKGWQRTTKLS